jgi:hypothetical protein
LAAFGLFPSLGSGVQFLANLDCRTNESTQLNVQWYDTSSGGTWNDVLQSDWIPNRTPYYRMHLFRAAGTNRVVFKITSTNGFVYRGESAPIPAYVLDQMKVFGLRVNSSQVEFDNLRAISPYVAPAPPEITEQPESRTVTTGAAVTFQVVASGPGPLNYQWRRNKVRLAGSTNDTYTIQNGVPASAGSYSVIVDNSDTASASSEAVLKVIDAYIRPAASSITNGVGPDGFALELVVPAGVNYVVQHALDLISWTELGHSVGIGSPVEFIDPGATNHPLGFYRLLLP